MYDCIKQDKSSTVEMRPPAERSPDSIRGRVVVPQGISMGRMSPQSIPGSNRNVSSSPAGEMIYLS